MKKLDRTLELKTERLVLRPLVDEDVPGMVRSANNEKVLRQLRHHTYPYTEKSAKKSIAILNRVWGDISYSFGLHPDKGQEEFAGFASIGRLDLDIPRIGFWLRESHWGKGYMTEAIGALTELSFSTLHLPALYGVAFLDNPAAIRVLEKCGFRERERKPHMSATRGKAEPGVVMELRIE